MTKEQDMVGVNSALQELISQVDVDAVGVASLAEWKETKLEEDALQLLPVAQSVVVLAMEISQEVLDLSTHSRIVGAPSMNDLLNAETDYINGQLNEATFDFAKSCRSLGLKALVLPVEGCPMDNRFLGAVFSYRHAGQAAGLGKMGWHSLLITPDFGPKVRIAVCLTQAKLEPTKTGFTLRCESCGICLDNCPAMALAVPESNKQYAFDKFACNSYRSASGGCSECVRVCPEGR
ncbi:MAG TPA: epoxyqueuosine reductase [Dehalococcoidia bacterium]|jgi:epoxyqueuosine reductase QueG|nr:epoxyqueuosine reductase [Dehalococcoidia bacterium]